MRLFLGVDTGATKSCALIASESGTVLGLGMGGPGNWEVVGWEGARGVLHDITREALKQAGAPRDAPCAAGFGLAGFDWPEDYPPHADIIRSVIGHEAPFQLVNDSFIGLPAGTDDGWGVVVCAGTSCNCSGRNAAGEMGRITGSSVFGEYAGAGELVRWAVQAVARAWSCRGPRTRLAEAFLRLTGARDAEDLLAGLMRGRYKLPASAAPVVFAIAAEGDAVAQRLVGEAGSELGKLVLGVSRQIHVTELAFDVVMAGSFFNGSRRLQEALAETVTREAPKARFVRLDAPPVVGAVLLGMELARVATPAARRSLIETVARHVPPQKET
jgi:N-acetylglucosamine kinase-like BadF-type ATPase